MSTLEEWQRQLASHFEDVTLKKRDLPHEPVTFALEHGLNDSALNALSRAIQVAVNSRDLSEDHYLCWTTYASEIGYGYAGDQYWHTFEQQTPGWDQRDRQFIKSCFRKFSTKYNGAVPRGPWAQNFSIICWPITHAILPKDLQRQLAEILYRIRHSLLAYEVQSPSQLGLLIETYCAGTTSRFQQLASEAELIGRLAWALLNDDRSGRWIETKALARITADLSAEEQARSWLNDAKLHARQHTTLKGLRRPHRKRKTQSEIGDTKPKLRIRPSLCLRPENTGVWRLMIDAPDLSPLIQAYPDLQPLLLRARLRLGNQDRRYRARALLHSSQSFAQSIWPTPRSPLISFEPSNSDLDALLAHTCSFPDGPWLFRLGVDGVGREIRSRRVSPNGDYIVVQGADYPVQKLGEQIKVGCENVIAHKFKVTSLDEIAEHLSAWRLEPARQIFASPCGLTPARWDREGAAEWLSNEQPIVHLRANYPLSHYEVSIVTRPSLLTLEVRPTAESSAFVVLPKLPAGLYSLKIVAHPLNPSHRTEEGEMEIAIRDASASNITGVALLVTQEPPTPSIEELFEGKVNMQILGPTSRTVSITLRLARKDRTGSLFEKSDLRLALPVTAQESSRFIGKLLEDEGLAKAYAEADRCDLRLDGGDLGAFEYQYDRPYASLRWGVSRQKDGHAIALYDAVDTPASIETFRYDFSTPLTPRVLNTTHLSRAAKGNAPPGLYLARTREFVATAVVPVQSFEELRLIRLQFSRPKRTPDSIKVHLEVIDNWANADTRGNLYGRNARRRAVRALIQQVVGIVAGPRWYRAERAYDQNDDLIALSQIVAFKRFGKGWSELLIHAISDVFDAQVSARVAYLSKITRQPLPLCDFALRLSSDPSSIEDRSSAQYDALIRTIMQRSELTRAARLLVLGTTAKLEASQDYLGRTTYLGWQWN